MPVSAHHSHHPFSSPTPHATRCAGFTLVELLVVISIIALLIAILLPSLGAARTEARIMLCMSQQRQMSVAYEVYMFDANDYLPSPLAGHQRMGALQVFGGTMEQPVNLAVFYAEDYLADPAAVLCSDHTYSEEPFRQRTENALRDAADDGQYSQWHWNHQVSYITRAPLRDASFAENTSSHANVWHDYVRFGDSHANPLAPRRDGNLTDGRTIWTPSALNQSRLLSPVALLMCAPPTQYSSNITNVHSRKSFNVLFMDGVVVRRNFEANVPFAATGANWGKIFEYGDTSYPNYKSPYAAYPNVSYYNN